jgi:hypothetical protein
MDQEELEQLRKNVLGNLQVDYLPQYTQAVARGAEQVRGTPTWAVELTLADNRVETYSFDQETGLLVMRRSILTSSFADFPTETWFMDYNDIDGVQLPMTVITASVTTGIVRKYERIRLNVPMKPEMFQPPKSNNGTAP